MAKITRRKALGSALASAAVGVAPFHFVRSVRAQGKPRVVISGWGGATQQAMRDAYFAPFTQATGIEVVEQTYGGQGLARVKAQLAEGGVQVDLLDGAPFWVVLGKKQNLLERISLGNVTKTDFMPGALDDYAFGYATVAWGITYNKERGAAPTGWRDFWDTTAFKGRRALFGPFVARHLEYALMAAGVSPKDIYPLDNAKIDRAFAKLAEIKRAINVWYQTGVQCEQLLLDRQIDYAEFFSGRAFYLQDQGVPVEFVWDQAILNLSTFVMAKGAPHPEHAIRFLEFIAAPAPQAAFAYSINHGPTNTRALALIKDRKILERLPTFGANLAKQIVLDADWWGENQDHLGPRWNQLITS